MELKDAIEEVKRVTPNDEEWCADDFVGHTLEASTVEYAIATILNAVVKGELKE